MSTVVGAWRGWVGLVLVRGRCVLGMSLLRSQLIGGDSVVCCIGAMKWLKWPQVPIRYPMLLHQTRILVVLVAV